MKKFMHTKHFIFIFFYCLSTQVMFAMNIGEQTPLNGQSTITKQFAECAYGKCIKKSVCTNDCEYNNKIYCRTHTFTPLIGLMCFLSGTPNIGSGICSGGFAMCLDLEFSRNGEFEAEQQVLQYQSIPRAQVISVQPQRMGRE